MHTQPPRLRTICVEIAPSNTWRNCDAHLLREHSVSRYCAHYKLLQICANSTYASTHASFLCKKQQKYFAACAKKKKTKKIVGFEPAIFNFTVQYSIHSAICPLLISKGKFTLYIVQCSKNRRNFGAISAHASTYARNCAIFCAIALIAPKNRAGLCPCASKNHYIAPRIRAFRRLGNEQTRGTRKKEVSG